MTGPILFSKHIPPRIEEVKVYFNQRGVSEEEAEEFFLFYDSKKWTSKKGNLFKSWKHIAYRWIETVVQKQPELFNRKIH
jgi:hypothetical protein